MEPRTMSSKDPLSWSGSDGYSDECDFCRSQKRGLGRWLLTYHQGNVDHQIKVLAHSSCLARVANTLFGQWEALELDE